MRIYNSLVPQPLYSGADSGVLDLRLQRILQSTAPGLPGYHPLVVQYNHPSGHQGDQPPLIVTPGGVIVGGAGGGNPLVPSLDTVFGVLNTDICYFHAGITLDTTAEHGRLLKVGIPPDGMGLGIGDTDGDASYGNNLMLLKEGLIWDVGPAIGTGFHTVTGLFGGSTYGSNNFFFYIDGSFAASGTSVAFNNPATVTSIIPGTSSGVHVHYMVFGVDYTNSGSWDNLVGASQVVFPAGYAPRLTSPRRIRRYWAGATATGSTSSASIAEGSATAVDTESVVATFAATATEGSATAAATQSAAWTTAASVAEAPIARNLLQYTEAFGGPVWNDASSSITTNAATSPDGSVDAEMLVEDSSNGFHYVGQNCSLTASAEYCVSVYAKSAGRTWMLLLAHDKAGGSIYQSFDLGAGAVGSGVADSASITSVGNGWYRCAITFPSSSGASSTDVAFFAATGDGTGAASYLGNGSDGLYLWGAQLELTSLTAYQSVITTTASPLGAYDTPDATVTGGGVSVSEGSATAADTPTAQATFSATVAEGSSTGTDTPSAVATFAASLAETGSATDTPSASATFAGSVAEGSSTGLETADATKTHAATCAEGSGTAADTPSASVTQAASVSEGSATGSETADAALTANVTLAEGSSSSSDTPTASGTYAGSIAEGSSTGADAQDGAVVSVGIDYCDEGSSTAADAVSCSVIFAGSIAEGTATATDTAVAAALWAAFVGEGSATSSDTASAVKTVAASTSEGSATGDDTCSTTGSATASCSEAGSAIDTPGVTVVFSGSIAEGTASALDLITVTALWHVTIAEGSATALDNQFVGTGHEPITKTTYVIETENAAFILESSTLRFVVETQEPRSYIIDASTSRFVN